MRKDGLRTKHAYVEALLQLSEVKPLKKITVSELIEATDTARQTFYNYFKDINDLIAYVLDYIYLEAGMEEFSWEGDRAALQFALEHKGFFCQIPFHEGQNSFKESYAQRIKRRSYQIETFPEDFDPLLKEILLDAYAHGVAGIFLDWCESGMAWPIDTFLEATFLLFPDPSAQKDNRP